MPGKCESHHHIYSRRSCSPQYGGSWIPEAKDGKCIEESVQVLFSQEVERKFTIPNWEADTTNQKGTIAVPMENVLDEAEQF